VVRISRRRNDPASVEVQTGQETDGRDPSPKPAGPAKVAGVADSFLREGTWVAGRKRSLVVSARRRPQRAPGTRTPRGQNNRTDHRTDKTAGLTGPRASTPPEFPRMAQELDVDLDEPSREPARRGAGSPRDDVRLGPPRGGGRRRPAPRNRWRRRPVAASSPSTMSRAPTARCRRAPGSRRATELLSLRTSRAQTSRPRPPRARPIPEARFAAYPSSSFPELNSAGSRGAIV